MKKKVVVFVPKMAILILSGLLILSGMLSESFVGGWACAAEPAVSDAESPATSDSSPFQLTSDEFPIGMFSAEGQMGQCKKMGINFIQGRPSLITEDEETHNLFVHSEDITLGQVTEYEYDMVMLNQAAVPQEDVDTVSSVLNIQQSPGGWFMEYHPKLRPADTPTDGLFLEGECQGPKDIPAAVASGSATAARAGRILHSDEWKIEPIIAEVWDDRCIMAKGKKCGICATSGSSISTR